MLIKRNPLTVNTKYVIALKRRFTTTHPPNIKIEEDTVNKTY